MCREWDDAFLNAVNKLSLLSNPAWYNFSGDPFHKTSISNWVLRHRTWMATARVTIDQIIQGVHAVIPSCRLASYGNCSYDLEAEEMYSFLEENNFNFTNLLKTSAFQNNAVIFNKGIGRRCISQLNVWTESLLKFFKLLKQIAMHESIFDAEIESLLRICMQFLAVVTNNQKVQTLMERDILFVPDYEQLRISPISLMELHSIPQPYLGKDSSEDLKLFDKLWLKISSPNIRRLWKEEVLNPVSTNSTISCRSLDSMTNFLRRERCVNEKFEATKESLQITDAEGKATLGFLFDFINSEDTNVSEPAKGLLIKTKNVNTKQYFPEAHGDWTKNLFPYRLDAAKKFNSSDRTPIISNEMRQQTPSTVLAENIRLQQMNMPYEVVLSPPPTLIQTANKDNFTQIHVPHGYSNFHKTSTVVGQNFIHTQPPSNNITQLRAQGQNVNMNHSYKVPPVQYAAQPMPFINHQPNSSFQRHFIPITKLLVRKTGNMRGNTKYSGGKALLIPNYNGPPSIQHVNYQQNTKENKLLEPVFQKVTAGDYYNYNQQRILFTQDQMMKSTANFQNHCEAGSIGIEESARARIISLPKIGEKILEKSNVVNAHSRIQQLQKNGLNSNRIFYRKNLPSLPMKMKSTYNLIPEIRNHSHFSLGNQYGTNHQASIDKYHVAYNYKQIMEQHANNIKYALAKQNETFQLNIMEQKFKNKESCNSKLLPIYCSSDSFTFNRLNFGSSKSDDSLFKNSKYIHRIKTSKSTYEDLSRNLLNICYQQVKLFGSSNMPHNIVKKFKKKLRNKTIRNKKVKKSVEIFNVVWNKFQEDKNRINFKSNPQKIFAEETYWKNWKKDEPIGNRYSKTSMTKKGITNISIRQVESLFKQSEYLRYKKILRFSSILQFKRAKGKRSKVQFQDGCQKFIPSAILMEYFQDPFWNSKYETRAALSRHIEAIAESFLFCSNFNPIQTGVCSVHDKVDGWTHFKMVVQSVVKRISKLLQNKRYQ